MLAITRHARLGWLGAAVMAGALLGSCQKSGLIDFQDAAIDAPAGTVMVEILDNPGHAPHDLVIPSGDVTAGMDQTYAFRGCANHCHMITFTAADFKALQAGMTVMETSTVQVDADGTPDPNPHTHVIKLKLNTCPDSIPFACMVSETCDLPACGS